MPIDPKQALDYLGVNAEEMESIDAFKEHVNKTYVPRAEAHKDADITKTIFGKANGALRTKFKGVAKELDINDVKWDEIEPSDGIDLIAAAAKGRTAELSKQIKELQAGAAKPSKDVEELTRKYDEAKKLQEQLTEQLGGWENKYKELEGSVSKRERESRVNAQWERALGGIKANEGISPLAIKGFHAAVKEKYAVEFDDEGTPYALDLSTKKRVPNPNKAHDFLGLDDLVKQYAEAEKIIGGNPQGGRPVRQTVGLLGGQQQQAPAHQDQRPATSRRTVMPA